LEQKYQIGNEYGNIMWDVSKILHDKDHFKIVMCDVNDLSQNNTFNGNGCHIMSTDISQPVIVVQLSNDKYKLIDGNHRLQKALRLGIKEVPAYILSFEEHAKYIIDFDEQIYHDVVHHW